VAAQKSTCDERHSAWALLLRAHSTLVETIERELQRETDLPLAWFDVLVQLQDRRDGRMQMNELANRISLSKSGVTRLIDRMERAGLIKRTACEADRRVVYAQITAKGRGEFAGAAPVAFAGVRRHFTARLTRDELNALEAALGKLVRSMSEAGAAEKN
jgi:DNA-binding MarR family transcriptional regulator